VKDLCWYTLADSKRDSHVPGQAAGGETEGRAGCTLYPKGEWASHNPNAPAKSQMPSRVHCPRSAPTTNSSPTYMYEN
jgi:hypothetical protein